MSRLQYRLPIGTDPRGRQKIYFCCHPDDFDTYFDVICKDIFAKEENCVIFYESDSDEDYDREELLFQLEEMQLFVVPVTEKLLTKKSRALELEIPFALGKITAADKICHHIAVLPILRMRKYHVGHETAYTALYSKANARTKHHEVISTKETRWVSHTLRLTSQRQKPYAKRSKR